MAESYQIRQVNLPDEYTSLIRLWGSVGPGIGISRSDDLIELEKKFRLDPDLFLVAEEKGQIIGSVIGGYDGRRGLIYHLAITVEHQHRGLGDRMLKEIEARLKARGCIKAYLLVKQGNPNLEHFYEKREWQSMDDIKIFGKNLL
jgi:ribosomal protein S18 acetylase RimI-like enzyme